MIFLTLYKNMSHAFDLLFDERLINLTVNTPLNN